MIYIAQTEVFEYLEKCEKPVTRRQIAEGIDFNPERVSRALRKLLKFNEIDFIEHPREEASKLVGYVLLRRTRFFFIAED